MIIYWGLFTLNWSPLQNTTVWLLKLSSCSHKNKISLHQGQDKLKCVFMSAVLCTNPVKLWLKYCGYYNMIMLQYDNTLTQCSCYPSSPQLLSDTSHRLLIVIQMSAWDQFFWARVWRLWAVAVHRVWSVEMVVSQSRTLITAITITITSSQHQAIHFIGATCDHLCLE